MMNDGKDMPVNPVALLYTFYTDVMSQTFYHSNEPYVAYSIEFSSNEFMLQCGW